MHGQVAAFLRLTLVVGLVSVLRRKESCWRAGRLSK